METIGTKILMFLIMMIATMRKIPEEALVLTASKTTMTHPSRVNLAFLAQKNLFKTVEA